jgi:hypothetical protein
MEASDYPRGRALFRSASRRSIAAGTETDGTLQTSVLHKQWWVQTNVDINTKQYIMITRSSKTLIIYIYLQRGVGVWRDATRPSP